MLHVFFTHMLRVKRHAHWMVVQVVKECETRGEQAKGKHLKLWNSVDTVILTKFK
jgi:hypothetical protein